MFIAHAALSEFIMRNS